MEPPAVATVLVAVDGSEPSFEASTYAVALADRYGAELVALYVHGRAVDDVHEGLASAEDLSSDAAAFLSEVREVTSEARVSLRTATAYGFSTERKLVHPGSVALDAAEEFEADFLVIPREAGGDRAAEGVLTKAAEYALLYASQPVLAV